IRAVRLRMVKAAHPRPGDFRTLRLVKTIAVGLPQIEHRSDNRLTCSARDLATDEARNAWRVYRHVATVGDRRRVGDMEGTFHGTRGRTVRLPVVDRIDQHADAKNVGHQDEFLAL